MSTGCVRNYCRIQRDLVTISNVGVTVCVCVCVCVCADVYMEDKYECMCNIECLNKIIIII